MREAVGICRALGLWFQGSAQGGPAWFQPECPVDLVAWGSSYLTLSVFSSQSFESSLPFLWVLELQQDPGPSGWPQLFSRTPTEIAFLCSHLCKPFEVLYTLSHRAIWLCSRLSVSCPLLGPMLLFCHDIPSSSQYIFKAGSTQYTFISVTMCTLDVVSFQWKDFQAFPHLLWPNHCNSLKIHHVYTRWWYLW